MAAPTASEGSRQLYFTRARSSVSETRQRSFSSIERTLALLAFTSLAFLYVALPTAKLGGLPVRGIVSLGLTVLLPLAWPSVAEAALRKFFPVIALTACLALIGIFTSLANGNPVGIVTQTLLEVHLQIAVLIFVAGMLAEICGNRLSMLAIVALIWASGGFALLQMLEVDAAWAIRQALGPLAKEELRPTIVDRRPPGLSYSPIQLSTQLCLAFAALGAVRHSLRSEATGAASVDPTIMLALLVLFAGSIATATRSPILGGVVFLIVYALRWRKSWLPFAVLLVGALAYLAWPLLLDLLQAEAPRILRTDDNSAATRSVFTYYGFRLFVDNPLGYGFGFQPTAMWAAYWPELYMMRGSAGVQEHVLHNYLLSMINIYGIGILLVVPWAARLLVRSGPYLIFFVPYAVHIMFHNSGPLFSDMIIWFVVAAIAAGAKTRGGAVRHRAAADAG